MLFRSANSDEPYVSKLLKRQVDNEEDKELKIMLNDSYHKILLFKGNNEMQIEALQYFENRKNSETLSHLNNYITLPNIDKNNIKSAKSLIEKIESRESTINIFQNLFSGLSLGSILILIALGLSIIYGLAGVINMSHGEFLMIGAYTTFCIQEVFISFCPQSWFDVYFFISLPASFIVAGIVGVILERLIIRQDRKSVV